mmetsp:Transcript_20348/g.30562  ORF Transcript_20348/g.30562 Transcript_20348/m.30562 type:complete len:746 (+) Transcript_20348:119-2356(+)|eukprot:CAMPEP_0203668212 /NCGR_PEP_ID=MMETSP0090-20130426/4902_1 /ASSEMBLY_ACC=CAM_ASM_001088 /TAXON_ID=426623 /ORGANISM="Chaetoceros affinis, Strain CCMP159" /LENGTH=745 /DNA_ID=CAMNT_0050532595 /DNA_START=113 /DNA_END=2350 /DNA_ORIENTATION=-
MALPPTETLSSLSLFDKTTILAQCFESIADSTSTSTSTSTSSRNSHHRRDGDESTLMSPLMIFNAGTILYEAELKLLANNDKAEQQLHLQVQQQQYEQQYKFLSGAFYDVLAHSNRDYVSNVIFHEINTAFISIVSDCVVQCKLTAAGLTTTGTAEERRQRLRDHDNQVQKLLESIRALCGILNALATNEFHDNDDNNNNNNNDSGKVHMNMSLMQNIFNEELCNQLVMLYDALLAVEEVATSNNDNSNTMETDEANVEWKECILSSLSSLLLYGLISPKSKNKSSTITVTTTSEDEAIQQIMEVIQGLMEHNETSFCLGDLQLWQEQKAKEEEKIYHHHQPMLQMIQPMFSSEVSAQKEYLISVLKSAPQYNQHRQHRLLSERKGKAAGETTTTKHDDSNTNKSQKKISALDRLIQQVRAIFPHLGEGYIETALACYNHDIEQTTVALMESEADPDPSNSKSLHPRLRVLDKSLPARRKESKKQYGSNDHFNGGDGGEEIDEEEREAMEVQKARIKEMVSAQEEEAYKLGMAMAMNDMEYNDDYDDQYDGIGDDGGATGGIGAADAGLYDMDFESIRTYNKAAREVESDRLFWEENRNTNRSQRSTGNGNGGDYSRKGAVNDSDNGQDNSGNDSGDDEDLKQKKYRGPDKGKGGRLIGPDGKYLPHPKSRKKGGKANQNNASTSTTTPAKNNNQKENSKAKKSNAENDKNGQQLSKIQKRRKNDNKAKIANHHRKERALKKSGM